MPITNFNPEEFAKGLAKEAIQFVPQDFKDDDKNFVVQIIYRFCTLAGNALKQDDKISINADQAVYITQLIGEWSFHKSIDLIKSGVPKEFWEAILQKIAFTVFEIGKNIVVNGIEQEKAIQVTEEEVKKIYRQSIEELVKQGKIPPEMLNRILSQSNLDQMAQNPDINNLTKEEEERAIKFASFALLLKTMPENKVKKILSNLNIKDAAEVQKYMQLNNLEQQMGANIAGKALEEFKNMLPKRKKKNAKINSINKLYEIIENVPNSYVNDFFKYDRKNVRGFINSLFEKENNLDEIFSPYILNVIKNFLEEKLNINDH